MKDSAILRMILEANIKELLQVFEQKTGRVIEKVQIKRNIKIGKDACIDIDYVHVELVV